MPEICQANYPEIFFKIVPRLFYDVSKSTTRNNKHTSTSFLRYSRHKETSEVVDSHISLVFRQKGCFRNCSMTEVLASLSYEWALLGQMQYVFEKVLKVHAAGSLK